MRAKRKELILVLVWLFLLLLFVVVYFHSDAHDIKDYDKMKMMIIKKML